MSRLERLIFALAVGIAAGANGYISHGFGFGLVCGGLLVAITLAAFDAFDSWR